MNSAGFRSLRRHAAAVALMTVISAPTLHAASGAWNIITGGGWGTAGNWSPSVVPGSAAGDVVTIGTNITATAAITLDANRTVGALLIGDTDGSNLFSLTGNTLILDQTGVAPALVRFGQAGVGTTTAANSITSAIQLNDNARFYTQLTASQAMSGIISGAFSVTYDNDDGSTLAGPVINQGQFTISGANTYTLGTTIDDARVTIQTSNAALGAAGTAVNILDGGQVFNSTGLTAIANAFTIAGNGWLETAGQLGALRLDSGAIVTGTVAMSANAAIGSNSGTGTVNGVVSGVGFTLTKVGVGTLALGGANTYSGGTTVGNGALLLNNNSGAGTLGISLVTGGTSGTATRLLVNGGVTIGNAVSIVGNITGLAGQGSIQQAGIGQGRVNGAITITGSPTAGGHFVGGIPVGNELVLGGAISSTVQLTVREGRVVFMGGGTGYTSLLVTNTVIVGANNGIATTANVNLGGSSSAWLELNGFDQSLAGLTLGNTGAGNNFIGTVNLGAKTLTLTADIVGQSQTAQTVTHVVNATPGGALNVGASARTITLTDTVAADDMQINGAAITGTGGIIKAGAGALALNGVIVAGPLAVNVGTLATGAGAQVGSITSQSLAFATGTTLRMKVGTSGDVINTGTLTTAGTTTVRLNQIGGIVAPSGTPYPLINYTGTSPGLGGFSLAPMGHATASLTDTGTAIAVSVTANDKVIWDGTASTAWTTAANGNWKLATPLTATDYIESDDVIFQDTPTSTTVAIAANVTPSNVTFTNTTATAYTVSGAAGIIGPTGLSKTGNGTLALGTPNFYTGPTNISAGTLTLTGSLNGSSVTVGAGATLTASGAITGTGVSLTSSGTTTLSGANTYTGPTNVLAGTLSLTAGGIGGVVVTNSFAVGSTITIASGATLAQSGGTINGTGIGLTVASGGSFNQTAGVFAGANNTLVTSGTTTLTGTNTFTGDVTLSGGTLTVAAMTNTATTNLGGSNNPALLSKTVFITNNAIFRSNATWNDNAGSGSNLQVVFNVGSGGATFDTPSGTTMTLDDGSAAGNANNAAQFQGTGNLTKIGDGMLSLGNGTSNFGTFTGQIFVNQGTLTTGSTSTNPFGTTAVGTIVASGATLDVKAAAIGAEPLTISGTGFGGIGALISSVTGGSASGPITLAADSSIGGATALALSGVISGNFNLTKVGAGTTTLSNIGNTYGGNTIIAAGQLTASDPGTLPSTTNLVFTGGTLDPSNDTHSVASISGASGSINQGTAGTGIVRSTQSGSTVFDGTVNRVEVQMNGSGSLTLGGSADNASVSLTGNAGSLVLAKGDTGAVSQAIHAVGTTLIINSGATVQLAGSYDNTTTPGTGVNLAPLGIDTATYVDQIYNGATVNLNGGGTLDLNGRQEAVSNLTHTTVSGGTVTNSSATAAKIYIGHQNGSANFAGVVQDGSGGGGVALEKVGTGAVILNGGNTYTGATTVAVGTLIVVNNISGSSVTVADGASLMSDATFANVTLGTATSGSVLFNPNSVAALTGANLAIVGTAATVDFATAPTAAGPWTAINYTTKSGAGAIGLANAGAYRVAPTVTDTGSSITVTVTGTKTETWTGSVGAIWDSGATANTNWNDGVGADNFFAGDTVTFPEGGANPSVTVTSGVSPWKTSVTSATTNYTLNTTTLGIAGPGILEKSGASTLTLVGPNTYGGKTVISGGTLVSATLAASLGNGLANNTIELSGGGRLSDTGAVAFDLGALRNISIGTGGGSFSHNNATGATITISGKLIGSGPDNLSFHSAAAGGGIFVLTGDNSGYTGKISVDSQAAGLTTLRFGNQGAVPAGGSITLNYPAAGASGNASSIDLPFPGRTLPAGLTINMTSSLVGATSLRSQITANIGNSIINSPVTFSGTSIIQFNVGIPGTITYTGAFTESSPGSYVEATAGSFSNVVFLRGNGTHIVNNTINLPSAGSTVSVTDGATAILNTTGNVYRSAAAVFGTMRLGISDAIPTTARLLLGQAGDQACTLDLFGFNQTVTGLDWLAPTGNLLTKGISNTHPTATSTFTVIQAAAPAASFNGTISGRTNFVKEGAFNTTLLAAASNFTGNVTVNAGTLIAPTIAANSGATGTLGAANVAGKTVTVGSTGTLSFTANNIFGNGVGNANLPAVVINGGILTSTRYNVLGPVTLDGGTLTQAATDSGGYEGYQFRGNVTVGGSAASVIATTNGKANHLGANTVFNVADATGDALADLIISAPLRNQSADFGSAAGALTKTGNGTLTLSGAQNYATLTTSAGTTNVEGAFTGGTATVNANAATIFSVDQTLAALNIGDGAVVTVGSGGPSPFGPEGAMTGDGFDSFSTAGGADAASAVVPEPGTLGLLVVGALGVLGRRRRR